ncbi:helix-turn-helix transcriptional regulator [Pseudomonas sp. SWRI74]|uniref:Helix-turn-helix transcriptional regulator n=1 Tax=Pseudomonas azerbaijanoccidentalis TaxID=2842347 RepID=A0ABS6QQJ7_9PSED|nr:helix-turn-helix transcriptional regulator [Pseudomonas azerbaijanoccidentalis]MBV4521186.1 helix-turn-helix transcriptional regulator [Pseudomonas azerbaijanoccidentalis]
MSCNEIQPTGSGASVRITQSRQLHFRKVHLKASTLLAVRSGQKCLRWAGKEVLVQEGDLVAFAAGQTFDEINTPCASGGVYKAEWLICEDDVVRDFLERRPTGQRIAELKVIHPDYSAMLDSFNHACAGVKSKSEFPSEVVRSRLFELLAWLDHHGGYFSLSYISNVSLKVRLLINSNPGEGWTATDVAQKLGMSVATMRRRLVTEGTHFQELLTDVRMSRALTLLQFTDFPITSVACEVGYECSSRFSFRFRKKFGLNPSGIRSVNNLVTDEESSGLINTNTHLDGNARQITVSDDYETSFIFC